MFIMLIAQIGIHNFAIRRRQHGNGSTEMAELGNSAVVLVL